MRLITAIHIEFFFSVHLDLKGGLLRHWLNIHLAVEVIQNQSCHDTHSQTDEIYDTGGGRYGKALKRNDHQGGGDYNPQNGVEGQGIMMLKERVDQFCQTDYRNQSADAAGNQNSEIQMSDAVHKGGIQSQRHKECRKAHAGCDDA